jgi:hypothetical protein
MRFLQVALERALGKATVRIMPLMPRPFQVGVFTKLTDSCA